MKLLDVNIWLALVLSKHTHHRAARAWLEGQPESASLCFCRVTQQGLVRLLTTAEVLVGYGNPPLIRPPASRWPARRSA
jgi:predicted nucleic acid-binding protein